MLHNIDVYIYIFGCTSVDVPTVQSMTHAYIVYASTLSLVYLVAVAGGLIGGPPAYL